MRLPSAASRVVILRRTGWACESAERDKPGSEFTRARLGPGPVRLPKAAKQGSRSLTRRLGLRARLNPYLPLCLLTPCSAPLHRFLLPHSPPTLPPPYLAFALPPSSVLPPLCSSSVQPQSVPLQHRLCSCNMDFQHGGVQLQHRMCCCNTDCATAYKLCGCNTGCADA